MLDVIICADFGVEKLRGLGNTRGQILEFPIEMAGHLYNRAGATAQPVICMSTNRHSPIQVVTSCHLTVIHPGVEPRTFRREFDILPSSPRASSISSQWYMKI